MEKREGRLKMKAVTVNYSGETLACVFKANIFSNNTASFPTYTGRDQYIFCPFFLLIKYLYFKVPKWAAS